MNTKRRVLYSTVRVRVLQGSAINRAERCGAYLLGPKTLYSRVLVPMAYESRHNPSTIPSADSLDRRENREKSRTRIFFVRSYHNRTIRTSTET